MLFESGLAILGVCVCVGGYLRDGVCVGGGGGMQSLKYTNIYNTSNTYDQYNTCPQPRMRLGRQGRSFLRPRGRES